MGKDAIQKLLSAFDGNVQKTIQAISAGMGVCYIEMFKFGFNCAGETDVLDEWSDSKKKGNKVLLVFNVILIIEGKEGTCSCCSFGKILIILMTNPNTN